jgi:hypothetical protein
MILYEDAWPRIMNAWRKHHRNTGLAFAILFNLWDTLNGTQDICL